MPDSYPKARHLEVENLVQAGTSRVEGGTAYQQTVAAEDRQLCPILPFVAGSIQIPVHLQDLQDLQERRVDLADLVVH